MQSCRGEAHVAVLLNSHAGRRDPAVEERVAAALKAAGCDAALHVTDGARIAADCAKAMNNRVRFGPSEAQRFQRTPEGWTTR